MRNIWDQERQEKKKGVAKTATYVPKEAELFRIKHLTEIQSYFLDYSARRQSFQKYRGEIAKIFSDYGDSLGKAGFLKINYK